MSTVDRTNLPDQEFASGAITPLLRASAHIGFALGGLASVTTESWEEQKSQINADVRAELTEAINHMTISVLVNSNAYISADTVQTIQFVITQLSEAQNADFDDLRDVFDTVQNIGHNLAYAGELIDRDTFGLASASAGRNT